MMTTAKQRTTTTTMMMMTVRTLTMMMYSLIVCSSLTYVAPIASVFTFASATYTTASGKLITLIRLYDIAHRMFNYELKSSAEISVLYIFLCYL